MELQLIDWIIISGYFILTIVIGLIYSRRSGKSTSEYFLSGRNMPWWLLGTSMVATTFSADTPNLVTDIVRQNGVAGNWVWWAFLLTGMMTVFIYSRLWRRSAIMTDMEFYELRYSGKPAAFLRGFRAVYLGVFFNIMIMATVSLAFIKICSVMLQWSPLQTLLIASVITVIYSSLGGLKGVIVTDFFQFFIAMLGSIGAAVIALKLPEVGGLHGLVNNELLSGKLSFFPDFSDKNSFMYLMVIPLTIQWWAVWYPGAEPGGGGYIAQRMLSAKNENHAMSATLLFNIAHYAIRPWPWIIVALASLIVYPDLASLSTAFPHIKPSVLGHDLAYPAMLTFLPSGLLGIALASLIAAYMSTISTHLNWGASYVVNDVVKRFVDSDASDRHLVTTGRITTVILMVLAGTFALYLDSALQGFQILLQVGAGTGLIFILRWFWWRINAYSEITAMVVSFLAALYFQFVHHPVLGFSELDGQVKLILGVLVTTVSWVVVTFLTEPADIEKLKSFYKITRPGGPGWAHVINQFKDGDKEPEKVYWNVPNGIFNMVVGCLAVYSILFATGYLLYGNYFHGVILSLASVIFILLLFINWKKHRKLEAGKMAI